jgi:hypothetical protein
VEKQFFIFASKYARVPGKSTCGRTRRKTNPPAEGQMSPCMAGGITGKIIRTIPDLLATES